MPLRRSAAAQSQLSFHDRCYCRSHVVIRIDFGIRSHCDVEFRIQNNNSTIIPRSVFPKHIKSNNKVILPEAVRADTH